VNIIVVVIVVAAGGAFGIDQAVTIATSMLIIACASVLAPHRHMARGAMGCHGSEQRPRCGKRQRRRGPCRRTKESPNLPAEVREYVDLVLEPRLASGLQV
jgi:hypothetical protein